MPFPTFSETYCGIFAYKGGNVDLFTLRDKLKQIKHQPDLVVILDQGILVKVDDFIIRRMQSMSEKKANYYFNNPFDKIHRKVLMTLNSSEQYIVLEHTEVNINLVYFYIFLIDYLNEYKKVPESYAADIISVWKQE